MADSFRDAAAGLYRCRIDRLIIGFFLWSCGSHVRCSIPIPMAIPISAAATYSTYQAAGQRQTSNELGLRTNNCNKTPADQQGKKKKSFSFNIYSTNRQEKELA
jgi:hypothetical protein